jgi:putative membrane protein
MNLFIDWFLSALALYIVAAILPGFEVSSFVSALLAIIVIGLVNLFVKPIMFLLTLPLTILTFGLFTLVLNAGLLLLAGSVTPGFTIDGLGTAFLGSILFTALKLILHSLTKKS